MFKFVKAAVLLGAGVGALTLANPEPIAGLQDWLEELSLGEGHRFTAWCAEKTLALLDPSGSQRLGHLAIAAFLFAALFVVEGVGLARGRVWAEYLTVAVTISFLPIELVAAWHRWSLLRSGTIVLNIGVVVYLLVQLRSARAARRRPP